MTHLFKIRDSVQEQWNKGSACLYLRQIPHDNRDLPIAVNCRIGNLEYTEAALLDTAADWSIISRDIFDELESDLIDKCGPITLESRFNRIEGELYRTTITLIADEGFGTDLPVECTVFASRNWPGPSVIGFNTFLDKIRFAIDPSKENERIYFGGE